MEYYPPKGLSEQASSIRDFVKTHSDYESIRNFIDQFSILDQESVNVLRWYILAGFWTSYYGFGWKKEQEIKFWELVYEKRHPQCGLAIFVYYGDTGPVKTEYIGPPKTESLGHFPLQFYGNDLILSTQFLFLS